MSAPKFKRFCLSHNHSDLSFKVDCINPFDESDNKFLNGAVGWWGNTLLPKMHIGVSNQTQNLSCGRYTG